MMPKKCEKRTLKSRACVPLRTYTLLLATQPAGTCLQLPACRYLLAATAYSYLLAIICLPLPSYSYVLAATCLLLSACRYLLAATVLLTATCLQLFVYSYLLAAICLQLPACSYLLTATQPEATCYSYLLAATCLLIFVSFRGNPWSVIHICTVLYSIIHM
jgi:hypothetical protein